METHSERKYSAVYDQDGKEVLRVISQNGRYAAVLKENLGNLAADLLEASRELREGQWYVSPMQKAGADVQSIGGCRVLPVQGEPIVLARLYDVLQLESPQAKPEKSGDK